MERWRIDLFGGLTARRGERVLTRFETRKIDALLACLSLHLNRPYPREVLAEVLWPDEEWEATRNRLRQALSSLRHDLDAGRALNGSVLLADRSEVRLDPAAVTTDVAEFEAALAASAHAVEPADQARLLLQAIDLYRGELLPGYYDEWAVTERDRLAESYRDALVRLANALAAAGDLPGAIETARRAIAADPIREDAYCDLMAFYASAGRTSEAIRQYRELERVLREELGASPSAASQAAFRALQSGAAGSAQSATTSPVAAPAGTALIPGLEPEGGAVRLDSPFYIVRPTDREFQEAIARRDSIVLVKGPRQIGKTSLLARGLHQARKAGASVVMTDLQKLGPEQLVSAAALFRTLAEMVVDQLDLDLCIETAWNPHRGWNVNFERFLRREVLGAIASPLVWGLDEVDRLFHCPFSSVVFGLFRSWHNERALNPGGPWDRLTLAVSYATEAHLFITDLNQSPFNVGTRLTLNDFTRGEVEELNRRYGGPLGGRVEMARFVDLVGGHPYLARRGLHAVASGGLGIDALEAAADEEDGPFADHLRRMLTALVQDADLCEAMRAVLQRRPCPTVESFYRLRSAGVIAGTGPADARPRCRLYQLYLERHLL